MKKRISRVVCLLMSMILLVSMMSITAFADDGEKTLQYDRYTLLGDSNAAGYGLDAYFELSGDTHVVLEGQLVPGTYAALVADAVGAETVNCCAHSGWRTTELLRMLDPAYTDYDNDDYSQFYDSNFFLRALNFVSWDSLAGMSDKVIQSVENSDLITLNFGSNDIFTFALTVTVNRYSYLFDDLELEDLDDVFTAINVMLQRANEIELKGIVAEFVTAVEYGLGMYEENMPLILDRIKELNSDAEIVVVGISNPTDISIDLSDDISIELIQLSDLTVFRANQFLKALCEEYGVLFADVTGTECFGIAALDTDLLLALDADVKYSAVKMVHPTEDGHQYMASKILDTLEASTVVPVLAGSYTRYIKRNTLTWEPVDGAMGYTVYRADSESGDYYYVGLSLNTVYVDYATFRGNTYYYKVKAIMNETATITTPYSNVVSLLAK